MPDYKKGQIYRIVCNITGKIYVGSTIQSLSCRLTEHRSQYKKFKEGETVKKKYVTSFQIIEQGNYEIVLIEKFPCESKTELHRRERHFIENLQCVNKVIPTRTYKEWCVDNKEKIVEQDKMYYQANKKHFREYYQANKEQTKQYQEENKEHIKKYREAYYEKNKEQIAVKGKEKVKCECGCEVTKYNLTKHQQTEKHICLMAL